MSLRSSHFRPTPRDGPPITRRADGHAPVRPLPPAVRWRSLPPKPSHNPKKMIGVLICTGGIRGLYRGSLTGFTHLDTHAATFTPTLCRVSSSSPVRVPCLRAYSGRRRSPPAPLLPAHWGTHSRLGFLAVVSPIPPHLPALACPVASAVLGFPSTGYTLERTRTLCVSGFAWLTPPPRPGGLGRVRHSPCRADGARL